MNRAADDPDDLLQRTHALDDARALVTQLEAENVTLRRKAGDTRPSPKPLPAGHDRGEGAAYRSEDRLLRLERDLHALNLQIANLSIENAILQSRIDSRRPVRPSPLVPVVATLAITGAGAAIWFGTENVGLLLMAGLLLGFCVGAYRLIGTIQPDGRNPPAPPQIPGNFGT